MNFGLEGDWKMGLRVSFLPKNGVGGLELSGEWSLTDPPSPIPPAATVAMFVQIEFSYKFYVYTGIGFCFNLRSVVFLSLS